MFVYTVTVSEWVLLLIFTIYLLYIHAHREVNYAVKLFTFVGWFMGFSIIAILPLDIFIVRKIERLI